MHRYKAPRSSTMAPLKLSPYVNNEYSYQEHWRCGHYMFLDAFCFSSFQFLNPISIHRAQWIGKERS